MKKYLLCVMAMVCVSIGAWAEPDYDLEPETGTWKNGQGKVVVIKLKQTGGLKAALEKLAEEIAKPGAAGEKYKNYTMLRIESENNVVLNDDDITALNSNSVTAETIDMQNLKTNPSTSESTPIAFDNSSVVNLILPDGWGKADVNRAAQGCSHLGAAFSMGTVSDLLINNNPAASITAYVKTPGTLHDAIDHSYYTKKKPGNQTELVDNKKLRANGVGEFYALDKLGKVTISGTPSARDYCNGTMNFDPDGHFQFDVPAIEQRADQIRTLVGTPAEGALTQAKLMILDLGDAVVLEEDLILSKTGFFNDATAKMIVIPTSSQVTTLPADFLNCDHGIHELCIPANIQYIKSRAFKGFRIDHIFTTNPDPTGNPNLKVDNGIVMSDGQTYTGYQGNIRSGADGFDDFKWGTYTLPPNLQLIETAAFGIQNQGDPKVKDLYMLSIEAPECHVDAFPPVMYQGNNTFDSS